MISSYLCSSIITKDFVKVLEDLLSLELLYLCNPLPVYLKYIRESINYVASTENTFRNIIIENLQGSKSLDLFKLRNLDETVDVVITKG